MTFQFSSPLQALQVERSVVLAEAGLESVGYGRNLFRSPEGGCVQIPVSDQNLQPGDSILNSLCPEFLRLTRFYLTAEVRRGNRRVAQSYYSLRNSASNSAQRCG